MLPITAILIGAGQRGKDIYGNYALVYPNELKFVAVADPNQTRREEFSLSHSIADDRSFESWEELLALGKIADVAFVCTQDKMHTQPALKAMEVGYDVLLEKPMATTLEECKELVTRSISTKKILQIGHVLRFSPFFTIIKQIIETGKIGEIVNISWRENVSYWHYAHSYIRGNWRNTEKASPMILAKCCHDLDLLYWMIKSPVVKLSSFGNQKYFGRQNQPKDAPDRCTDGCPVERTCEYYAPRLYVDIEPLLQIATKGGPLIEKVISKSTLKIPELKKLIPQVDNYSGWPISTITDERNLKGNISKEMKERALNDPNNGYGQCVYAVDDHDVVDHQIVSMEFENGVTATLTMHGFAYEDGRTLRIDGTKATIIASTLRSGSEISIYDSYKNNKIYWEKFDRDDGHGGGDDGLIMAFIKRLKGDNDIPLSDAKSSLESHLMAFAAEISRKENRVVNLSELR